MSAKDRPAFCKALMVCLREVFVHRRILREQHRWVKMLKHESAHLRKHFENLPQLVFLHAAIQVLEVTDFAYNQSKSSLYLLDWQPIAFRQILNGCDSRQSRVPPTFIIRVQWIKEFSKLFIAHRKVENRRRVQELQKDNLVHDLVQKSDDQFPHHFGDDARLLAHRVRERV